MSIEKREKCRELVKEALLKFGGTLPKDGTFTGIPEADVLIRSNPFAFLMAASIDRGARAETVWKIPWYLKQKMGNLDPEKLSQMTPAELEDIIRQLPKKPRFPNQAAKTIVCLAKLVSQEFCGDAEQIWQDKSVDSLLKSLQKIYGVGPGIAAMTVRILIDEGQYHPQPSDLRKIDIKPDIQVTKVFCRSGLSPSRDGQLCIEAARQLIQNFLANSTGLRGR